MGILCGGAMSFEVRFFNLKLICLFFFFTCIEFIYYFLIWVHCALKKDKKYMLYI